MRRNLNENVGLEDELGVKICVSEIRNDDPSMDCNELRDIFVEEGAEVEGSHGFYDGKPATFMTVIGLSEDRVIEILQEFLDASDTCVDAQDYIDAAEDAETDDIDPETQSYLDADEPDYPAYEDVELDPEEDALNDDALNEGDDVIADAEEELRNLLAQLEDGDVIAFEEEGITLDEVWPDGEDGDNIIVYSIDSNGDMEIAQSDDLFSAFQLVDADDIYTICDVVKDRLDFDAEYPEYDDVDIDDEEQPRFEKMKRHGRLDEKKKNGCCPGTKTVNESKDDMSIDDILADIDSKILNENQKVEADKEKKLEAKTLKALTEQRYSLHTNISYNGKSFDKMTLKQLKSLYETIKASVDELKTRSLNESVVDQKLMETLDKKNQLLEYIDEEITYRVTRQNCLNKLNEDGAEISDKELATLFGPAQGEDAPEENNDDNSDEANSDENNDNKEDNNKKDNDNEDGEVVELSRIEITLKDEQAANDLKQACLDADIPEDAFELENVEDDTFDEENSDENSDENSEENSDENSEENAEENNNENANESYEYAKYVKFLAEGEFPADDQPADDAAGDNGDGNENGAEDTGDDTENTDNEDSDEEDKQPKFILTNTDYAGKLAKVLEDVYGISKDEFEEMIGGKIEEDSDEDSNNSDENSDEENSEENSDSSEENSDENKEEDDIDPSDLFKNL